MVRPCIARRFRRAVGRRSCINVSGLLLEAEPQAIMDISALAISLADRPHVGPFGSPVFACAGKTEPSSRLIFSQTLAGKNDSTICECLGRLKLVRLEASTTSEHAPSDTRELVGKRDRKHVMVQSLLGGFDPRLEPVAFPSVRAHLHKRDPGCLHE